MFVTAILFLCWSAISWFSAPLEGDFLGLPLFAIDAVYPFFAALIFLVIGIALWIRRSGSAFISALRDFFTNERSVALTLIGILILHVILQLPAIIMYQGAHDADSALYGLAGFEIADGHMRPMFNIGKHHMGSLVPHLLALLNLLFGDHAIFMRILLVAFYVGFLLLLFLFVRIHFDNATALLAILLAAIAPEELYKYLKHPENSVTLFLGMLSLLLVSQILKKKSPHPRLYFYLGCVLGLGLWTNYQFAYFIIAAALIFLTRNRLFFLKPAPWATVAGLLTGGVVILVDGYFYSWPFIKTVEIAGNTGSNFFSEFVRSVGKFFSHVPALLGSAASEPVGLFGGTDIMPPWFSVAISLLFWAAVLLFVIAHHREIALFLAGKDTSYGSGIIVVLAITIFLVYTISSYSHELATTRYIMPFWIPAVVMLAGSVRQVGRILPSAAHALAALFAALFLFSSFFQMLVITTREGWHRTFVTELRNRNIDAFYGPWLRTYWTTFVTDRRIIGSASYPTIWNPITRYNDLVDNAVNAPAFLFIQVPTELAFRDEMLQRLDAVDVTYRQLPSIMGALVYGFSERVTPKQFYTLAEEPYRARVLRFDAHTIEGADSEPDVIALNIAVENSGDVPWLSNGRNGQVELLLSDSKGAELSRVPVARDVAPGQRYELTTLLGSKDIETNPRLFTVANDFIINEGKVPAVISKADENIPAGSQTLQLGQNLVVHDGLFVGGWGRTLETERGTTRWSGAKESIMVFPLLQIRELDLHLSLWPYQADNMPEGPQRVGININGERLETFEPVKFSRIDINIPEVMLRIGINRISFSYEKIEPTYSPLRTDGDPNNTNPRFRNRPRAVAFSEIVLTR